MAGKISFAAAVSNKPAVSPAVVLQPEPEAQPPCDTQEEQLEAEFTKKKKKKLSKSERLAKREAAALKKIYGPKDAHVSLISAEQLQKFNQRTSNSKPPSTQPKLLLEDFPSIGGDWPVQTNPSPTPLRSYGPVKPKPVATTLDDFPALCSESQLENKAALDTSVSKSEAQETKSHVAETKAETPAQNSEIVSDLNSEVESKNEELPQFGPLTFGDAIKQKTVSVRIDKNEEKVKQIEPSSAPPVTVGKKKSKKPIVISIDELLSQTKAAEEPSLKFGKSKANKDKRVTAPAVVKVTEKKTLGNILDSTGPVLIKRGKIREQPKKKRPTRLKRAILASRTIRSKGVDVPLTNNTDLIIGAGDQGDNHPGTEVQSDGVSALGTEAITVMKSESKMTIVSLENDTDKAVVESKADDSALLVKLLNSALEAQIQQHVTPAVAEPVVVKEEGENSVDEDLIRKTKAAMHSRKFRPYCNMHVSTELHGHVIALLKELHRFQDRLYKTDPIKYQIKRRYVHGIKNVITYLQINKVVLVILAPDMEPSPAPGGLDEQIAIIMAQAKEKNVPVIFSGNRFILGKPMCIKSQVSAVAILDKQGADEHFAKILETATNLRKKYEDDFSAKSKSLVQS